jgi:hypothetical protein
MRLQRGRGPRDMKIDIVGWSGEGAFTQELIERLQGLEQLAAIKVENAPSTRSDADYNFVANEIFVTFATSQREEPIRHLGIFPGKKRVEEKALTLTGLAKVLENCEGIGPADYGDEGMLQYLRTERIIPPYQTRGYKLVELVRIYEVGTPSRA